MRPPFDAVLKPVLESHLSSIIDKAKLRFLYTQRILVVVDGGIQLVPGPNAFGVGRIIEIIDDLTVGLASTHVIIADRAGAPGKTVRTGASRLTQPTYTGFTFDRTEAGGGRSIDLFDQIWCFGFDPAVHNPLNDTAIATISASEVSAVRDWMDHHLGGVLAMGDHGLLGADMCAAIPRVKQMRRWRKADDVPDQLNVGRLDTHRPQNAAQSYGTGNPNPAMIPSAAQMDAVPQPIEWVPDEVLHQGILRRERPHPVLCHPELGPIDVLPDHAHEGRCHDSASEALAGPASDFPTVAGQRPVPRTIAYGHTLPHPPWNHVKGPQPAARFPLITVYDGQRIGIGRVVVDSTWHHWFDLNIWQLESAGGDDWSKIRRYFENVAIWLAKPAWRTRMLWPIYTTIAVSYLAAQEIDLTSSTRQIGRALIDYLNPRLGPCWVSHLLIDLFDGLQVERVFDPPIPDPCLSCPPFEIVAEHVFGAIGRAGLERGQRLREVPDGGALERALRLADVEAEVRRAAHRGLAEFTDLYAKDLRHAAATTARLGALAKDAAIASDKHPAASRSKRAQAAKPAARSRHKRRR